jgi:hypothetical protein
MTGSTLCILIHGSYQEEKEGQAIKAGKKPGSVSQQVTSPVWLATFKFRVRGVEGALSMPTNAQMCRRYAYHMGLHSVILSTLHIYLSTATRVFFSSLQTL